MSESESWDEYAEGWDSNSAVIEYSELAFDSLCKVQSIKGLNVLDFGCGTGLLTEKIASLASAVLAVDPSEKMIEVLNQKQIKNVTTLHSEISEEAIKRHALLHDDFDLIVASSVCAFLPDFDKTLIDLKSLLKQGGIFIQWDWKQTDEEPDFGFTEESIAAHYTKAGLTLLNVSNPFSLVIENGAMEVIMGIAKKP